MTRSLSFPGGIDRMLSIHESRRDPFDYAPGEALAQVDIDLDALAGQTVADPQTDPAEQPPFRSTYHAKRFDLRTELQGRSELAFLNALLVAHLRKRTWPDHAPALFVRLWAEQADHLMAQLDLRWLVSAVTTFGDHGTTAAQRSAGLALGVFLGTIKLYESERLHSGRAPSEAFPIATRAKADLPLQMDRFSIRGGDLDTNLIARLWEESGQDPVFAPLGRYLLQTLVKEDKTLFARFQSMRGELPEKPSSTRVYAPVPAHRMNLHPDTLRWGIVSTIKAPADQVFRFAAHHLERGADHLHIYLDEPGADTAMVLARHPKITVVECDDAYWDTSSLRHRDKHTLRQTYNATRSYKLLAEEVDWLAHIDGDEFLTGPRPIADILADTPASKAVLRIPPAEALANESGQPVHFKRGHKHARQPKTVLQDIYPTFGMHLYAGFLSHSSGKVFARTGIPDCRLGIHRLLFEGAEIRNQLRSDELNLLHFHAPSWSHFLAHLETRLTNGSYNDTTGRSEMSPEQLMAFLMEEDGVDGLRGLFDEVCADTPALRNSLKAHDMLIRHEFDFDGSVERIFGSR